jgi:hypothetical protein
MEAGIDLLANIALVCHMGQIIIAYINTYNSHVTCANNPGAGQHCNESVTPVCWERVQRLSKVAVGSEKVENNQSVLLSLTDCGKKAMTPRGSRASGPMSLNMEKAREISIVEARLSMCSVRSMLVWG